MMLRVRVDDVNLCIACDGLRERSFIFRKSSSGRSSPEAFSAEPGQRVAIGALDAQCEMNIVKVDPFIVAERRVRANQDVEFLLSLANLVPDSRIIEAGTVNFLHFQDVRVELSRTLQVVNGNENMMEGKFSHDRQIANILARLRDQALRMLLGQMESPARTEPIYPKPFMKILSVSSG